MSRVIVTVKREGEARVRDLEVPSDMEAGHLSEMIAHTLHWDSDWDSDRAGQAAHYQIEAQPLGRVLQTTESLENAGVFDGAWLVFKSSKTADRVSSAVGSAATTSEQHLPTGGPTTGRTTKILPDGYNESSPSTDEKPSSDFKWKQLD